VHGRRVATGVALLISVGSLAPLPAAHAASGTTLYVNNAAAADCSDTTADSSVTPYCTIQAAVNAATSPGDVVFIDTGYYAPFSVTASGTADAPIRIESSATSAHGPMPTIVPPSALPAMTVQGASYVDIQGLRVSQQSAAVVVQVTGSNHVTVTSDAISQYSRGTAPAVSIDSESSYVTVSRNVITSYSSGGGIAAHGGTGDVITTNLLSAGPGISLSGTTYADVTSNTLLKGCGEGVAITGGSTSTTLENNVATAMSTIGCTVPANQSAEILVDSTSTSGTSVDYNYVNPLTKSTDTTGFGYYSWAGSVYDSASDFSAATGQGEHDLSAFGSSTIDDANSDAPGELTVDVNGNAWVDDPQVPNTGVGTYAYYDRGATATVDPITLTKAANWPTAMPAGLAGTFSVQVTDGWSGNTITSCIYNFGDGTATVKITPANGTCATAHSYSAAGSYSGTFTATVNDGYSYVTGISETVAATDTRTPNAGIYMVSARDAFAVFAGEDSWNLTNCKVDWGDGSVFSSPTSQIGGGGCYNEHLYTGIGNYNVTVTVTDAGGNTMTVTKTLTPGGYYYSPLTPTRVLDTRKPIGVPSAAEVAAGGTVRLKLAGVDGVPLAAGAVTLTATATNATAGGYVTVYPDGGARPKVSSLDLDKGQTVANTVTTEVGSDGYVDLYNGTGGSIDLVADLQGFYAADGNPYTQLTQSVRALDTRTSAAVPSGGTVKVNLGSYSGITAAMLNLTVTGAMGGGYITAYPDGGTMPIASNLNFGKGQTVANEAVVRVGSDGYVDFTNTSSGTVELIADLNGYFSTGAGSAFVPLTPTRVFDSRLTGTGAIPAYGNQDVAVTEPTNSLVAIAANLTVTAPTQGGYVTAYGTGYTRPETSTLNFSPGSTVANAATVEDFDSYRMAFYNGSSGTIQLIVDVFGYYS